MLIGNEIGHITFERPCQIWLAIEPLSHGKLGPWNLSMGPLYAPMVPLHGDAAAVLSFGVTYYPLLWPFYPLVSLAPFI